MAMFDQTCASDLLALLLNDTAFSAVAATNILLGTSTPTATSNMTQLSNGGGYTTGGSSITWNSIGGDAATSNSNTVSWTNSSGGSWVLVGLEIWNSGATVRYLFGTWTGQPVTVAVGNTFQVAPAAIQVALV
jgi:hypothetical protein